MILGIRELNKLVKEKKLVEYLCDRELEDPEGAGFDLRIGEVHELTGRGFIGIEERKTPRAKIVANYSPAKVQKFVFRPNNYYLIKTIEKVNLPLDISGVIFPRTTLFRSGLALFNGVVQPGYSGELTFGLTNLAKCAVEIELGARIVHITFHKVLGEGSQYRGQWQGGRIVTDKKEKQI